MQRPSLAHRTLLDLTHLGCKFTRALRIAPQSGTDVITGNEITGLDSGLYIDYADHPEAKVLGNPGVPDR
jgi:hypothetical protein